MRWFPSKKFRIYISYLRCITHAVVRISVWIIVISGNSPFPASVISTFSECIFYNKMLSDCNLRKQIVKINLRWHPVKKDIFDIQYVVLNSKQLKPIIIIPYWKKPQTTVYNVPDIHAKLNCVQFISLNKNVKRSMHGFERVFSFSRKP